MDRVLLPSRGLNMWIEISMPEPARDPLLHRSSENGATARAAAGMRVAFAADSRGKCPRASCGRGTETKAHQISYDRLVSGAAARPEVLAHRNDGQGDGQGHGLIRG
jgi:hypothetical protein